MDAQALLQEFLASSHGQQALGALTAQGISPAEAQTYVAQAVGVAHAQVNEQVNEQNNAQNNPALLGEHSGRNFFAAFASGLTKGDGIWGSIKDGLEGTLSGRITETIAAKTGMDPSTASGIAAALTPYIAAFLKSKLGV